MRKVILLIATFLTGLIIYAQPAGTDQIKLQKDSALRAAIHADSIKIEKDFKSKENWEKIKANEKFPVINAGEFSGIVPVDNPTEIPDPKLEYKLLFEVISNNADSVAKEPNYSLVEIARVINLHVASGIPVNKIFPIIVVHAGALNAISNNTYYHQKYKIDNPNLKLINELSNLGARFIACGQAMAFLDFKKENLLPEVKISLTAQTAITSYQLKGYVWRKVVVD